MEKHSPPLILNVDDSPTALRARTLVLEDAGFAVVEADSGRAALRKVEALRPDLVLLDVRLPDIDGLEVCRRIKHAHPELPVLQTSAVFTEPEARARGMENGADRYLAQPFEPAELIACVRVLLRLRRAESTVREQEARLRITYDRAPVGIGECDLDGRFRRVNDRLCAITGYAREELLQRRFQDITHPEGVAAGEAAYRRLQTGEVPFHRMETRYVRKDGGIVWVELTQSLVRDAEGKPLYGIGIVEDVTEPRQTREALRRSEKRWRTIFDSAIDYAIFTTDLEGRVTSWNPGAERLLGYAEGEMLGRPTEVIFTPEDRAAGAPEGEMAAALERGRGADERWHVRKDGGRFWANGLLMPLRDETGELRGYLKVMRDQTERRRMERELAATNARLSELARSLDLARVMIRGTDGRIISWSRGLEQLYGHPAAEALGRISHELLATEFPVPLDEIEAELEARGEWQGELQHRRRDGAIIVVASHWVRHRSASGSVSVIEVNNDAADLKRAEAEMRRLNEELEARVAERTAALLESEAARRRAEHMETLGRMTGSVAHDINNVLTVVLGNLEFLQRRLASDPKLQAMTEAAIKAAEKGERMAQDLLAFARKQRLDPQALDVSAVVAGLEDILRGLLPEGIALRLALGPGLPPAYADQNQLERAVLNLVVNARDAMRDRGGTITVETGVDHLPEDLAERVERPREDYVRLTVRDEGGGMPDEVREHAFEPFFTTKTSGTGLGLSQVYGFVRQSRGHVAIDSREGEGTTVTIALPRADAGAGRGAPPSRRP